MTKQTQTPMRKTTDAPDLGSRLKRNGHWYGSIKVPTQEHEWLVAFCYGMLRSLQDAQVEHTAPDEVMTQRILLSWQMWTTAQKPEALSFTGQYQTVQDGPIRLRQFQTETQHPVYLMETLCAYLPQGEWSFWYLRAKQAVLVSDQDGQPHAVFAEFVPQIPIRLVERNKGKK